MTRMDGKLSTKEWKEELVRLVTAGHTIKSALAIVGKHENTYLYQRDNDPEFLQAVENAKIISARAEGKADKVEVPDFPEFSEKYLHQKMFTHQLQWFDVIEGREPRDLHPSCTYIKAERNKRIVVNVPPNHAKSTTITVNYVIWRIIKNPSVKIIIVSKTETMAKKFLLQIKERLISNQYSEMQRDFAPKGGWKEGSASWTANMFYVNGRNVEAKDPTVWSIGIGSQIYGARADLVVVDDAIDGTNANRYPDQIEWLNGEVATRLTPNGKLFVVGTRIAAKDMYGELINPDNYSGTKQVWNYFRQPAVLEFADDPKDWVTLWPYSDNAFDVEDEPNEDGMFVRWDGTRLDEYRSSMTISHWSRMYQQEQLSDDSIFKYETVKATCQGRVAGIIPNNSIAGREEGMNGLYVIGGVDPAAAGFTAMVIYGVEIATGQRYVIDVWNHAKTLPDEMRNKIKEFTERYGVREWRIEENGFQKFLTNDTDLNFWLSNKGVVLTPHVTNRNKHDQNFGVMAMASLFDNMLIHLPNDSTDNIRSMIDQLVIWEPHIGVKTKDKSDIVMALWFCELRALELVNKQATNTLFHNTSFTTRGDKRNRFVVQAEDFADGQISYTSNWLK